MCIKINIKIIWLKIKCKTFLYDNQTKIKLFSLIEQCHDPVASDTVQTASSKKNEKQFLIKFKRESCKSYRWVYKFALTIAFIWFKLIYIRVCIYYSDIKKRKKKYYKSFAKHYYFGTSVVWAFIARSRNILRHLYAFFEWSM